jgi:hypothetical protein
MKYPKLIERQLIGSIKCDYCDYRDDNVPTKDYHLWLNRACPKCSANLLTQRDFDLGNKIEQITWWINLLFGWIGWFIKSDRTFIKTEMNENGSIVITDEAEDIIFNGDKVIDIQLDNLRTKMIISE